MTFYNLTLYPENAILHGTQTVAAKRILYEKNHLKPTFTKKNLRLRRSFA
jgi:hypothetical protein